MSSEEDSNPDTRLQERISDSRGTIDGIPWSLVTSGLVVGFVCIATLFVGLGYGAGVGVVEANETQSGVVQGSADLDTTLPENLVESGETQTLEFYIANDGEVDTGGEHPAEAIERATEARSVRIDISDTEEAPIDVRTGEQFVGTIASGDSSGPQAFEVFVEDDAEPGEYEMEVRVTYRDAQTVRYTQRGDIIDYDESVRDRSERFTVTIEVEDEARFDIQNTTHDVGVEDSGIIAFEITNTGTEAINDTVVTATAQDQDFFFGSGGASSGTFVGSWEPGDTKVIEYRAGTTEEAIRKFYTIDINIEYSNSDGEDLQQTRRTAIQPLARQQYQVVTVDHDVAVADDGVLALEIRNTGPRNVTEASVTVEAQDQAIVFGSGTAGDPISAGDLTFQPEGPGSPTSEAFVGDWNAGETITVYYKSGATENALERDYSVDVTINHQNTNGYDLTPRTQTIGLNPLPEQTFAIRNVESSLYVGEEGTLQGTVRNTGERAVDNVVVQYESEVQNFNPRDTQYAVGSLEPGETADFQFRIGVSEDAEAGPKQLQLTTRYRNHRDEVRLTDPQDVFASVNEKRDVFLLQPAETKLEAGSTSRIKIEVENNDDHTLTNIRAKLFTNSPLSSDDDEAFITDLDPGERTTLVFEISAGSGAVPKSYPVSLDFRYDDERDDTQLSSTYRVPVDVTEPTERDVPLWIPLVVLLIAIALVWQYRGKLLGRWNDSNLTNRRNERF